MTLEAELARGLDLLHLGLDAAVRRRLLDYLALVRKWNQVYNLTAVREPADMLVRHLFDSLAVIPHIAGERILDVGSGAGLPGIPLALALPRTRVTLLEKSHKKAAFLKQALIELAITNADAVNERVESWQPAQRFDVVISRAFSDLAEFVALAARHCAPRGRLAAMKGVYPYDEIAHVDADCTLERVVALEVPGLSEPRHLVLMRPS